MTTKKQRGLRPRSRTAKPVSIICSDSSESTVKADRVKTSIALDQKLYRRFKAYAAQEGVKVYELMEEGMRTIMDKTTNVR